MGGFRYEVGENRYEKSLCLFHGVSTGKKGNTAQKFIALLNRHPDPKLSIFSMSQANGNLSFFNLNL